MPWPATSRPLRCDRGKASWTYVSDACPSALINRPWPSGRTVIPVIAAMSPVPVRVNMSAPTPEIQLEIAGYGASYH